MKSQGSLWPYLWACAQDVSTLVTSDFERKDKEGLRGASRAGRTAVNATVSKLEISEEKDLRDLPQLRLHERFPRLASVALKGKRKSFSATTFNLFASETLSKLSKLTSLDLSHCNDLDAAPTCAALVRCPQLQELTLPEGADMTQAALGALAQLTRLTRLTMTQTEQLDAQGLQQLSSSLTQLQHLDLSGGTDITDHAVACLGKLKALTALDLSFSHSLHGSTLDQLAALSRLVNLDLSECDMTTSKGLERLSALQDLALDLELQPADVAVLTALTALTRLDAAYADITDECSALLRLPNLAWLHVDSISLTAPPAPGVLQQLTELHVPSIASLAHLLPLPKLQALRVYHEMDMGDEVTALVAAIARQSSLRELALARHVLSEQQVVQMVAPLKQLQSFSTVFAAGDTSCLAACAALAELPLLRKLRLWGVPQPGHLAMLARCAQLEELCVSWGKVMGGVGTGVLAALLCKPGMRKLSYQWGDSSASCDKQLLKEVAARAGVGLWV